MPHRPVPAEPGSPPRDEPAPAAPPRESYALLFARFLRFGLLAWGGPVAQIARLRHDMVERERWITPERFNRVLAVYQVLPGPEATELCCYFGMLSRGRLGSIVAGLGFVLPGFVMMLILSWVYMRWGIAETTLAGAAFLGVKPAVMALIIRAVHRIGAHTLNDAWLAGIAGAAAAVSLAGVHFAMPLAAGGAVYAAAARGRRALALGFAAAAIALSAWLYVTPAGQLAAPSRTPPASSGADTHAPTLTELAVSGLRAGSLTFGGAYTVIPFLKKDAVDHGRWITEAQFLDGLALGGVIPAPLVMFSTFIGQLAGGLAGAGVITAAIFLPAFAFTFIGHGFFERLVENKSMHALLDGVTAGVVGLIAVTACELVPRTLTSPAAAAIAATGVIALYRWKTTWVIPAVVLGAAAVGVLVF